MKLEREYDVVVIGGGFYGSTLAGYTAGTLGRRTLLVERESSLLARASYANQARVHGGYHYPRSLSTGYRSQSNFGRFLEEFRDAVDDRFESIYAVSRIFSNVTASQFRRFCERIGAPIEPASRPIRELFRSDLVEDVFRVREAVFDARKLRDSLTRRMFAAGVEIRLGTEARSVAEAAGGGVVVSFSSPEDVESVTGRDVFVCTYTRLNQLLAESPAPPIALKHELAEIALVRPPEPLRGLGVTVMCGPFFSMMPFPPRGLHSLSHVRYTPHGEWQDSGSAYRDPYLLFDSLRKESRHLEMLKDAWRYLPLLAEAEYVDSLWETKTVLPMSEVDDGRPILFRADHGLRGLHFVMGSKIDNVYDMIDFASRRLEER